MQGNFHRKITKCPARQKLIKPLQLPLVVVLLPLLLLTTSLGKRANDPCTLSPSYPVVHVDTLNANINKSNFHLEQIITKKGLSSYLLNDIYHVYYIRIDNATKQVNKTTVIAIGDRTAWKNCTYIPSTTATNNTSTDDILCEPNAIGDELKTDLGEGFVINIYGVHSESGVKIYFSYPVETYANMTVYFGETFVTNKYISAYEKICLARDATQDTMIHVLTETANCSLTNVSLKFLTRITPLVAMTLVLKAKNCEATFADFNWLILVKSKASPRFPVNGSLTLVINKNNIHKVSGIRSGFTDIFLVPSLQCNPITTFYMSISTTLKLNIDKVMIFSDACKLSYTFVHGEILTEQLYTIYDKAENSISVETMTGPIGIDAGVILRFSAANCALNVTLDTADDDFQPFSIDSFNYTIPDCGPLKCIKLMGFDTNGSAILTYIKVTDNKTGISIEAHNPGSATYCVNETRGDEKWTVVLSTISRINRLTISFEGSIVNEEHFYLGSLKASLGTYNIYLRNIGKLLCLHLAWYPSFEINNRTLELYRGNEKYTFLTSSDNTEHQATYPVSICNDENLADSLVDYCGEDEKHLDCDRNKFPQLKNTTTVWIYSLEGYTFNHVNLIHKNIILSSVPMKNGKATKSSGVFCYDKQYLLDVSYLTTFPPVKCKNIQVTLSLLLPNNIRIHYQPYSVSTKEVCEWKMFPHYKTILNVSLPYESVNMSVTDNTTTATVTNNDYKMINGSDCIRQNDTECFNTSTVEATYESDSLGPDVSTTSTTIEHITLSPTDTPTQAVTSVGNHVSITASTLPTTLENTFNPSTSISSTELTSESTPSNTSDGISCLCPCPKTQKNLTRQELTIKLRQIVSELTLPRNETSKYIRSKVSMPDDRHSSLYVSSFILIVVVTPFALIVLQDIIVILRIF